MNRMILALGLTALCVVSAGAWGCAAAGGLTHGSPKAITGRIQGHTYTSPNGTFRIRMPHPEASAEFVTMVIDEQVADDPVVGTLVTFGPSALDPNVYHVRVAWPRQDATAQLTFLDGSIRTRSGLIEQAERTYNALLTKIDSQKLTVNGHDALFAAYRQPITGRFMLQGANATQTRYHAMYFIDYGDRVALLWAEIPDRQWGSTADLEQRITKHQEPSINSFVSSLKFLP